MCRAESGAAGEEAADHPLPQSHEPGGQPQTAGAAAAAGCVATRQDRTEHSGESQFYPASIMFQRLFVKHLL